MDEQEELREWGLTEKLPVAFVKTLKYTINEKRKEGKSFMWAAHDFGSKPATLSRWVAGMGPLYEEDIRKLAVSIGILTYITLGFPMPDDTYQEISQ